MGRFKAILDENPRLSQVISHVVAQENDLVRAESQTPISDASSLLRGVCISATESAETRRQTVGTSPANTCLCRAVSQATQSEPLSLLHFRHVFRRTHYRHCPKYKTSERSLELMMRIIPPSWLLRHTINLSINVKNWQTLRNFSISPIVLGVSRAVDPKSSPSFRAIQICRERMESTSYKNTDLCLRDLLATLRDIFESQQGSPMDQDYDGNTILYVC